MRIKIGVKTPEGFKTQSIEIFRYYLKKGENEVKGRKKAFKVFQNKFKEHENANDRLLLMDRTFLTNAVYAKNYVPTKDLKFMKEKLGKYTLVVLDVSEEIFAKRAQDHDHPISFDRETKELFLALGKHYNATIRDTGNIVSLIVVIIGVIVVLFNFNNISISFATPILLISVITAGEGINADIVRGTSIIGLILSIVFLLISLSPVILFIADAFVH